MNNGQYKTEYERGELLKTTISTWGVDGVITDKGEVLLFLDDRTPLYNGSTFFPQVIIYFVFHFKSNRFTKLYNYQVERLNK